MEAVPARNIILVGLMGSGKSSLARSISRKTGCLQLDTDHEIEKMTGKTIPEIFAKHGEDWFREKEFNTLTGLQEKSGYIISTGGGIVIRELNRDLLKKLGLVVWLQASESVLFERVSRNKNRPLLHTPNPRQTLKDLMTSRQGYYQQVSDIEIDTGVNTRIKLMQMILHKAGWSASLA